MHSDSPTQQLVGFGCERVADGIIYVSHYHGFEMKTAQLPISKYYIEKFGTASILFMIN